MNPEITLVTGGIACGKSAWALAQAEGFGPKRAFIATATALDDEMRAKIAAHQAERGPGWQTFEAPRDLARQIGVCADNYDVILIDCLTMWLSNLLTLEALCAEEIDRERSAMLQALEAASCPVIVVTNEVTMGIMPADPLSRRYQRLLGTLNRDVACLATRAYCLICGIAQQIK